MSDRSSKDPGAPRETGAGTTPGDTVPPANRPTEKPTGQGPVEQTPPEPMGDGVTNETALVPVDDGPHPAERPTQREYAFAPFDDDGGDGGEEATAIDARHSIAEMQTSIIRELPQNPYLEVVRGPDNGKVFTLQDGDTTVGRAVENDAVLTDVAASRRHFTLRWKADGVRLKDLGSGNGTRVNDKRVYETPLKDGDVIIAGETHFLVRVPSGAATLVPATAPTPSVPPSATPSVSVAARARIAEAPTLTTDRAVAPGLHARIAPWIARAKAQPRHAAAVLGGAALVLGVLLWLLFRSPSVDETQVAADQAFVAGMARYGEGHFREAQLAFETVLKAKPDHAEARTYFERAELALSHQSRVRAARTALAAGDFVTAEREASRVPGDSPVAAEANVVLQEVAVRRQQAASPERAARGGDAAGKVSAARGTAPAKDRKSGAADTWRAIPDPTKDKTKTAAGSKPKDITPVAEPKEEAGTDAPRKVLALYKRGDFAGAVDAATEAADDASGATRKSLTELADRITRFQKAYEQATRPGATVDQLQSAVNLDELISGGSYASKLTSTLLATYLSNAKQAFERDNMSKACEATRQAAQVRASDSKVATYVRRCEEYAGSLMRDAKDAAESNKSKARDLYRRVMLVLPPSAPLYREASKQLSALGKAARQDEDE